MAGLNIAVDDGSVVLVLSTEQAAQLGYHLSTAADTHRRHGFVDKYAEATEWGRAIGDSVAAAQAPDDGDASTSRVRPTAFNVCSLPRGHYLWAALAVRVVWRGPGLWAVLNPAGECLGRDGGWELEPSASDRTPEWIETHRFDLENALEMARVLAPWQRVNGLNAAELLAREAGR